MQVTNDGATLLGRGRRFHSPASISSSFPVSPSLVLVNGRCIFAELIITQLAGSDRFSSWARQVVLATSATCNSCKKIVAGDSLSLVINIRKGIGSLQLITGGSGNRPSMLTFGGIEGCCDVCDIVESLRNRPDLLDPSILGAN